ncbi:MAG: Gx transporter family protein [Actinobacteria bacterium]|nr:Gx transporter family protein [Actinomycetota bacterium]
MFESRRIADLALLVSVGLVLSVIENSLPPLLPVPGAKLGLANIATVIALYLFGPRMAVEVTLLRTIIGGVLRGSMVGLLLSLAGGLTSTLVMIFLFVTLDRYLSIIGVSVAGAAAHNTAQLATAYLLVQHTALFYYLPYLLIISVPTGIFIGYASRRVTTVLKELPLTAGQP